MAKASNTISQAGVLSAIVTILIIVLIGFGIWWLWDYYTQPRVTIGGVRVPSQPSQPVPSSQPVSTPQPIRPINPSQPVRPLTPGIYPSQQPVVQTPIPVTPIPSTPAPPEYILYNFSRPNCPYCARFEPTWRSLEEQLRNIPNLSIQYIDTSKPENDDLTFYYNITSVPTIILVTPSRVIEFEGNRSLENLTRFVTSNLSA